VLAERQFRVKLLIIGVGVKEEIAIEALRQVKKALDKHSIEFWLNEGTLLGAVRDGKFIEWDNDIDLTTWDTEISKIHIASQELRNEGFKLSFSNEGMGQIGISKEGCPIYVDSYHLDGSKATKVWPIHHRKKRIKRIIGAALDYLHRVLSDRRSVVENSHMPAFITKTLCKIIGVLPSSLRRGLSRTMWTMYKKIGCAIHMVVPSYYFKNLSAINFYGMEFKVPAETEEYLAYKYGEDWRIPKRDWTYYDDGAIVRKDR